MSDGLIFKQGFDMLLAHHGGNVLIHKGWGTPNQKTQKVRAIKNSEKDRPNDVMFQFPKQMDIQVGDVIQQEGARDLWEVVDTEDHVHLGIYVHFEAKV
jgi:hypothetical protein